MRNKAKRESRRTGLGDNIMGKVSKALTLHVADLDSSPSTPSSVRNEP